MTDPERESPRRRADTTAQIERLERPSGSRGWRLSAIVVAIGLAAVVVVGRLGMDGSRPDDPTATPLATSGVAAVSPGPAVSTLPSAGPTTGPVPPRESPAVGPPVDPLPLATRYADGIPTSIAGERVLRLPQAIAVAGDDTFLVGGWYQGSRCRPFNQGEPCPYSRLGDSPADLTPTGFAIDLTSLVDPGSGPRVLRARLGPSGCATIECPPTLSVEEVVWAGDVLTSAGPIDVVPLMRALAAASPFPDFGALPYADLPECPVPWPPQTYRAAGESARMIVVFPTTKDREDAQSAIRASRSLLLAEQGGECLDTAPRARGTRWLAQDNVMLLVRDVGESIVAAERALADALAETNAPALEAVGPVTTWQALRRLWRVDPSIDVAPVHEAATCGPESVTREAYAVRNPHIRVLAVFPSRADRRRYDGEYDPGAFRLNDGCLTPDHGVQAVPGSRWIAFENVLLEFTGPDWLADDLRGALGGTGIP